MVEEKCHYCERDLAQFAEEKRIRIKNEESWFRICINCFNEREQEFHTCASCDSHVLNGRVDDAGEFFCCDCYVETYETCSSCDREVCRDNVCWDDDYPYCEGCWHDHSQLKEHAENIVDTGKLTEKDTLRVFGIELETIAEDGFDTSHPQLKHFRIEDDGSLSSDGKEFVSVPLPNPTGFRVIHDFCSKFAQDSLSVDASCGYHLHLFMHPSLQTARNLKKIWLGYHKFEQFFFSLVPKSRRDNSYCQSLQRNFQFDKIKNRKTLNGLLSYYYSRKIRDIDRDTDKGNKYNAKRYFWVNFHSLLHRNTLEIRLHNGTVRSKKIVYWYLINRRFISWILKQKTGKIAKWDTEKLVRAFLYKVLGKKLRRYVFMRCGKFGEPKFSVEDMFVLLR